MRHAVRNRLLKEDYRPLVADEGGFAPTLTEIDEAFDIIEESIRKAGFSPARDDMAVAVDVAATHFYDEETNTYTLPSVGREFETEEMVNQVVRWVENRPLVSIEDPLSEDDWNGWETLYAEVGDRVQLLGDDLLVTNESRLERAFRRDAANAVLVKPNQAGTLTRTLNVVEAAERNNMTPVVSARSGETCDTTIADLAVGIGANQIKIGSLARSERLAKYNRLLGIEHKRKFDLTERLSFH